MFDTSKKITRSTFRFIEKCFYDYPFNLKRLAILQKDLEYLNIQNSVKVQNYEKFSSPSGVASDPVFARMAKIEKVENEIKQVQRITAPISDLIEIFNKAIKNGSDYNKMLLQVLQCFYFDKLSCCVIEEELSLSRSSLYKKRCELVRIGAAFLFV